MDTGKYDNDYSAVLVGFCIHKKELSILFTKRSKKLKNFAGQVSFPGGYHDLPDKRPFDTVLRETREELGISSKHVKVIAMPGKLYSKKYNINIYPIIGFIPEYDEIKLSISPGEVDYVFLVNFENFLNKNKMNCKTVQPGIMLPFFENNPPIWGITALALHRSLIYLKIKEYPLRNITM
ncbi:hypothetical protein A3Q56_06371 [Intoshia linei]|uniref:Nudix hydrolase domain-containing protein n=1 Tax=Intoshia linei TaxID=1819745 RepID=A0A177AVR6_9BILA|nr:hypothetical protein A3Q56_06371 [Intoshia linei]